MTPRASTTTLLAGSTLAAVAVPQVMAIARLVGVEPGLGLTGFIIGAVVFGAVGAHRIINVGPDSSIAPLLAAGVLVVGSADGSLPLLSLMVAVLLIGVALIRGSWITQFLSRAVTVGLLAGIGLRIVISQMETVLAGPVVAGLSAGVLVIILVTQAISPRLPGALLALILAAAVTGLFKLDVAVLAEVDTVFTFVSPLTLPWGLAVQLLPTALVIALLITVQTGATEAATRQGRPDLDRDIGAIGVASAVSALFGCFALNASPARTRVIQAARGTNQFVSLVAAGLVALVLFFGGGLVPLLPEAAVSAVLVHIAFTLIRVKELRRIFAYSRAEFGVALLTVVLVVTLGIAEGVAVAVLLTLLDRTRRAARPLAYRKGLIPESNHWVPVDVGIETHQVPGVLVWSVEAPIWYADADYVVSGLHEEIEDSGPYKVVVLDAAAITDLDYTGVQALSSLVDALAKDGIDLLVARANLPTIEGLERARLQVPMFATVADAVKEGARIADLGDEFRAARGKKKDLAALEDAGLDRSAVLRQWQEDHRED
ncbi:SulP family inorganic anion transporter [Corynebacterium comes]|nr:SulP family inorganic anion transporter [Corynebacterium comes]